mgnify:CR=1 FL=1
MPKVRYLTKKYGFRAARALGQNFLADEGIEAAIIESLGCTKDDTVVEIGPGVGSLTALAAEKAGRVVAIELDERLLPILAESLAAHPNAEVLHADVLKTDIGALAENPIILGNIPYYISTPIIMKLIEDELRLKSASLMLQKEVAEKLAAAPSSEGYGVLAVIVQYFFDIENIADAPPEAFIPPPKVSSRVVKLIPSDERRSALNSREDFFAIVKQAFSKRRKTLANSLAGLCGMEKPALGAWLSENGIEASRRPETLSPAEFAKLSNSMAKLR